MQNNFQRPLMLALQAFQAGKPEEADHWAAETLKVNPKSADALHLRGVVAGIQNRHAQAEAFLRQAVEIDKKNHFMYFNLAKALMEQGKDAHALKWHRKALELDPKHDKAWLNYGRSLSNQGEIDGAIAAYDRAIALNANLAEACTNKAVCLHQKNADEEALALHDRALALNPGLAEAWSNRGVALNALKRHDEALASHERAIELKPDHAEAWNNRGAALHDLKRHDEALASYARAIELRADFVEAWNSQGVALNDLGRHMEALASYARAIEIQPRRAEPWSNQGLALSALERYDEAMASYERAIELSPRYAQSHYNRATLQLLRQDFQAGFRNYRWRWQTKDLVGQGLQTDIPGLMRDSPPGPVLLWAEQGLGDEILYAGMLPQAREVFPQITLSADRRLHPILARSFPGLDLVDRNEPASALAQRAFRFQAPVGDLGDLLGFDKEGFARTRQPFLVPDRDKTSALRARIPFAVGKPVCGIAWRSANKLIGDAKSIALADLRPLFEARELSFVNLQYGNVDEEIRQVASQSPTQIHQVPDLDVFNDIDGLLALIDACDVVVTTSNVTAHLAGSIGKRACILVPFSRGRIWYWHLHDTFSFWYPSLRVIYQEAPNDWSGAIRQAAQWIKEIA